jgi:hypothetical protein
MIQLTITYDGLTIDLQADGYTVLDEYLPNPGKDKDAISDRFDLTIIGSSGADLDAKVRAVESALEYAAAHSSGPEAAWINYAPTLSDSTWRSRLTGGTVMLASGFYRRRKENKTTVGVAITRMPWWEGAEAQVALTNPLGVDNTTGLRVYNPDLRYAASTISFDSATKQIRDSANGLAAFATGKTIYVDSGSNDGTYTITDGGHAGYIVVSETLVDEAAGATVTILGEPCNYVTIDGTDINGNLPAPARIEMTNQLNSTARLQNLYLWEQHSTDPSDMDMILQAEDANYINTYTPGTGVSYSHGGCVTPSWTGDTAAMIARWVLSSELLAKCAGHWFKLILRGQVASTGIKIQAKTTFPSGVPLTVVDAGPEITLPWSSYLNEVGIVQLPPWLPGETDAAPLDLCLYARKTGGGSLNLDCLHLCSVDGYRILQPRGYGAAYEVRVVDDGINGTLYTDGWTPAGKTGHYLGYGKQLMLHPGKNQRIYFAQTGNTGDSAIARALDVKVYYRPRRRTV